MFRKSLKTGLGVPGDRRHSEMAPPLCLTYFLLYLVVLYILIMTVLYF